MKLKIKKIDKAQALEFLTAHVEKAIFGILVLGFLLFCIGALKQSVYDKRPADFTQTADRINQKVESSTFDPAQDIPAVQSLPESREVPPGMWVTREVWNRPVFDVKKRRPEPKFLPLEDVHVAAGYGAIPVRAAGAAGEAARPNAAPAAPVGGLKGLRGAPGGADAGPAVAAAPSGAVKGKQWAVITGLVPTANQDKEYRTAFRDVRFTNQELDYPRYASFDVERAEVAPGSSAEAELQWVQLDLKKAENEEATIAEFAIDPVDQPFRDPVLTKLMPRVVGKDHGRSALHPKIPLGPQTPGGAQLGAPAAPQAPAAGRIGGLAGARAGGGGGPLNQPANSASTGPKVEHKLFRFFDFSVLPGKSYRYRIRLVLNNPNFGVGAQYLANSQLAKGITRPSPWSETSPEVSIPRGYSMLAGGIRKASGLIDSKAEVVLRMWDQKEAVDAAKVVELMRGQVANFPVEDVPIESGGTKRIPFQTDMLVLDMTGGDVIPGARVRAPSQLLVLEPNGTLAVKSELVDSETYEPAKKRLKELQDAIKPPPTNDSADDDKSKKKDKGDSGGGLKKLSAAADQGNKPGKLPRGQ